MIFSPSELTTLGFLAVGGMTSDANRKDELMPELPDIEAYLSALESRIVGRTLLCVRISSPFLLRTFEPPIDDAQGKSVQSLRRIGKRIAIGLDGDLWLVLHLMIAGRLHWKPPKAKLSGKLNLAAFDFENGSFVLTEAGSKRRVSLHVCRTGELGLHDRGGLEVLTATFEQFQHRLIAENHTLKRTLADPTLFSGIGNAYSDEILHRAKLSPLALTQKITVEDQRQLFFATRELMQEWMDRLRLDVDKNFPEHVTAFREEFAVHGKFNRPCPVCGTAVQRIRYAENETNYCPRCQTKGKLLADRSLSRLLKDDWPKSIDELEG